MPAPVRICLLCLFTLGVSVLGGCDPNVTVNPEIELTDGKLEGRVEELEAEAARHRERADALQTEVTRLQEESIVLRSDDGFTVRLNENAALVLVVLILGATLCFVSWMKHGRRSTRSVDVPDDA